jgi:hypothetical protein
VDDKRSWNRFDWPEGITCDKKNARVSNRWGEGLDRAAYRIAGAMEREDLPAVVPELGQPIDGVRPSRNSDWVHGIREFEIGDREPI